MTGELTLSIRPEAASIRSAQQAVAAHFRAAGLGAGAVGRAEVVVEEVALNAFRHGGAGEVTLEAAEVEDGWRLRFEDAGAAFDPTASPAAPSARAAMGEGGLGRVMVARAARRLGYARVAGAINRFDVVIGRA